MFIVIISSHILTSILNNFELTLDNIYMLLEYKCTNYNIT